MKKFLITTCLILTVLFSASYSQTVWEQTKGPFGGSFSTITQNHTGDLFLISDDDYLYRSKDDGKTWELLSDEVQAIVFDSQNNCYIADENGSIIKYDIDYSNPEIIYEENSNTSIYKLLINANDYIYYSKSYFSTYRTTDSGINWERIVSYALKTLCTDSSDNLINTFDTNKIIQSTDNGLTWNEYYIHDTLPKNISQFQYNQKYNVFLAFVSGSKVYLSYDKGVNWEPAPDTIPMSWVEAAHVDGNGNTYICGDSLLCISTDGGQSWEQIVDFPKIRTSSMTVKDNKLYFIKRNDVLYSYDMQGKSYEKLYDGIIKTSVSSMAINQEGEIFAQAYEGLLYSEDKGDNWTQIPYPEDNSGRYLLSGNGYILLSNIKGIYKTTDRGQAWSHVLSDSLREWEKFYFTETESGRIYAAYDSVYFSDDLGESWQATGGFIDNYVMGMESYKDELILIAAINGAYISDDGGVTFTFLQGKTAEPTGTKIIFAENGDALLNTSDWFVGAGATCIYGKGSNELTLVDSLHFTITGFAKDQNHNLYAYYENDIYFSKDNGKTWVLLDNEGLEKVNILDMCFANNGEAFIGTSNNGLFRTDYINEIEEKLPHVQSTFELFPNPVAEKLYCITGEDIVKPLTVSIVNETGQTVYSENYNNLTGNQISINTSELPCGLYFCIVNMGNEIVTKSFVVIR